jgi:hypothetical protein
MLSVINLPGIKALCVLEIISGRTTFNLLARIFEITLYKTLHKLIGLKSLTLAGEGPLGIRAILVELILASNSPEFRKRRRQNRPPHEQWPSFADRNKQGSHPDQGPLVEPSVAKPH